MLRARCFSNFGRFFGSDRVVDGEDDFMDVGGITQVVVGSAVVAEAVNEVFVLDQVRVILDIAGIRQVSGDGGPLVTVQPRPVEG